MFSSGRTRAERLRDLRNVRREGDKPWYLPARGRVLRFCASILSQACQSNYKTQEYRGEQRSEKPQAQKTDLSYRVPL